MWCEVLAMSVLCLDTASLWLLIFVFVSDPDTHYSLTTSAARHYGIRMLVDGRKKAVVFKTG